MKATKIISMLFAAAIAVSATAQTKIIAHRGYWNCEGSAQNSITSLEKSAEIGAYGSEFDVSITKDGVCVVNHDADVNGVNIEDNDYKKIEHMRLNNGEKLPTLADYLKAGRKHPKLQLILDIKPHKTTENEDRCIDETLKLVKKYGMEKQVEFISFSKNVCKQLAIKAKGSKIQYLAGDWSPELCKNLGLTGIDYHFNEFVKHPTWIQEAHNLGLTVNVWTVNNLDKVRELVGQKVDFITTDKPVESKQIAEGK